MHETDFTYDQTQQAVRERQVVELTTHGLYDIQSLSAVVNTSGIDSNSPPEIVIEWDGRESNRLDLVTLHDEPGTSFNVACKTSFVFKLKLATLSVYALGKEIVFFFTRRVFERSSSKSV